MPLALVLLLSTLLAWMLLDWDTAPDDASFHEALELAHPPQGGDFTLSSSAGRVSLTDFRSKVALIYFGYTWCPDICPLNLSYLSLALHSLTAREGEPVQVLFASVDPDRDTPQRSRRYRAYFAPDILGVTGTPQGLAKAGGLYGAAFRRAEGGGSAMGYSRILTISPVARSSRRVLGGGLLSRSSSSSASSVASTKASRMASSPMSTR
jgi:protein SCO1/2